jgi:hypothetical protein
MEQRRVRSSDTVKIMLVASGGAAFWLRPGSGKENRKETAEK